MFATGSDNVDEYDDDDDEWDDDNEEDYFDEYSQGGGTRKDRNRRPDESRPNRRKDGQESVPTARADNTGELSFLSIFSAAPVLIFTYVEAVLMATVR